MAKRYTAKFIEDEFKRMASSRISQKKRGDSKYAGDAGYWDGGRCDYGGAHNLQEDCERLGNFFSEINELKNVRKELINFTTQEEFEQNKKNLLVKAEKAISGLNMKTGSSTSIGGVCIISADFSSHFNSIINNFRKELEMLKRDIERVPYNEAKELRKLEGEERKIKKEIEENEKKARNETNPEKKKKFLFLANEAKSKWKKVLERKKQLKSSRLGDDFDPDSHIDAFIQGVENKLANKNKPSRATRNPNNPLQIPTNSNNTNNPPFIPNNNDSPLANNNQQKPSFFQKYWKELLFGGVFLVAFYYIYNQKDDNHE